MHVMLQPKTWKADAALFPCELSAEAQQLAAGAVRGAVQTWGERQLSELEAEERLAVVSEKAPTNDATIAQVRAAALSRRLA